MVTLRTQTAFLRGTTIVSLISKSKWTNAKRQVGRDDGGLASGDNDKALRYFHEGSRKNTEALSPDLPSIAAGMQNITFFMQRQYGQISRVENQVVNRQTITITYYVYFYLDGDGIWRIESFERKNLNVGRKLELSLEGAFAFSILIAYHWR